MPADSSPFVSDSPEHWAGQSTVCVLTSSPGAKNLKLSIDRPVPWGVLPETEPGNDRGQTQGSGPSPPRPGLDNSPKALACDQRCFEGVLAAAMSGRAHERGLLILEVSNPGSFQT